MYSLHSSSKLCALYGNVTPLTLKLNPFHATNKMPHLESSISYVLHQHEFETVI